MSDAGEMNVEQLSQLIAAQGREALLERLRTAYTEAAAAHSDIVSLDESRIEAMVQNAAKEADGLQWRRALAGVASRELGVSVAAALSHPAVVRAQNELGAPSYEQSLTELITQPVPPPLPPVATLSAPTAVAPEPEAAPPPSSPEPEAEFSPATHEQPPPAPAAAADQPPAAADEAHAPSSDSAGSTSMPDDHPYDDGYEAASPQAWENESDSEPVPVIEGQLQLAPESDEGPSVAAEVAQESTPAPPSHTNWGDDPDPPASFEHAPADAPVMDETLSEELEVIEADDTMVELLPEPEPVELNTQLYETVPLEADVVEQEEAPEPAPLPLLAGVAPAPDEPTPAPEPPAGPQPATYAATQPQSGEATPTVAPVREVEPESALPAEVAASEVPPEMPPAPPAPPVPVAPPPSFASQETATPPEPEPRPEPASTPDLEAQPEGDAEPELEPATFVHETPPENASSSSSAAAETGEVEELRINAIHLGGVANLPTNREGLDLRLSSEGLDIMRGEDEIIGRLIWDEIEALEVPNQRKRRRNSQPAQARLVVRTRHGDASFEVPGYSSEELRDRVDLRLESYARR